tara:strand:- start:84 stop:218 length:135 start_codon:yes stop_codon:yes gene_type:complete
MDSSNKKIGSGAMSPLEQNSIGNVTRRWTSHLNAASKEGSAPRI